jgi:hypothetical protein
MDVAWQTHGSFVLFCRSIRHLFKRTPDHVPMFSQVGEIRLFSSGKDIILARF